MKTFFSDLDVLEKILELVYDRAKVVTGIFRATHDEALCAVLRWSGLVEHSSRKIWYTHVYRMGIIMLNLIDRRQVTNAICIQFIQALQQRIVDNEESDEDAESINPMMDPFFVVNGLDARVDMVDSRLNVVTEQVEEQAREIERIDAKTLSYVPGDWGCEVTKLLNRQANNDWRLLKRFGCSTSELRHWALQADPTMTLLNEWFMAHKADEATYGLEKILDNHFDTEESPGRSWLLMLDEHRLDGWRRQIVRENRQWHSWSKSSDMLHEQGLCSVGQLFT
ncbi:unnamed protein product [Didymodactylos carnosus]|uniref:Death domain-containing protein n=1 Tax=Didymodactylos carnosus TaxID=1234261 RepID=A0A815EEA3_9BILA|nr:unnamed protein product [Didymodactylos carnosus]CAF4144679.1 unnamed protein product [Didymodactylos carnosus]